MTTFDYNTKYSTVPSAQLVKGKYADGSIALVINTPYGERQAVATVCMVDSNQIPAEGNVFVKDYSENEGTLTALQKAGIVGEVIRSLDAGWAKSGVHEVKLLVEVDELV